MSMNTKMILTAIFVLSALLMAAPAQGATLYVATNGSDGNPCTQAAPCASLNGAYGKASGGDTVIVAGGTYGSQSLTAGTKGSVVTFQAASGASVTIASLTIRTQYVEVQNLTSTGGVSIAPANNVWTTPTVNHVTLRNVSAKHMLVIAEDVLVQGGRYGGFDGCDASNPEDVIQVWQLPDSGGTYHASSRVTFDGVVVHDITDHNNTCSDVSGSANGRHVDCMQILAGHFITVRNSIFYNCATSDIIARPFRDTLDNLTFENNFFGEVLHPGAALNLGASGDTFGGGNVVRNNYIASTGATCQPAGCLKYYGNIMSTGSCGAGITYDGNVFEESWSAVCGTNGKKGQPSFVGPTPPPGYLNGIQPNFHLASNDTVATAAGSLVTFPAADIDGEQRPTNGRPDAGADQRTSVSSRPNPPTNLQVVVQ